MFVGQKNMVLKYQTGSIRQSEIARQRIMKKALFQGIKEKGLLVPFSIFQLEI